MKMKMRFSRPSALFAALISCLGLACAAGPALSGSPEPFHAAHSAPEKALNEIFHRSDNDDNLSEFVLKRPWYDAKKDKGYATLFTQSLLAAWASAEAQLVQQDCQGKYLDGEICGIDYSPITCGNATSDKGYVFRTKQADDRSAILFSRWAGHEASGEDSQYRMVKEAGSWRLDGVDCGDGAKFNMN
jgi:hypothetical protein